MRDFHISHELIDTEVNKDFATCSSLFYSCNRLNIIIKNRLHSIIKKDVLLLHVTSRFVRWRYYKKKIQNSISWWNKSINFLFFTFTHFRLSNPIAGTPNYNSKFTKRTKNFFFIKFCFHNESLKYRSFYFLRSSLENPGVSSLFHHFTKIILLNQKGLKL